LALQALKVIGPVAIRLLVVPTLWEAIISGTVAQPVFGMPWLMCYMLGFILTAVGPAIVIQLMFDLQKEGWGVDRGAQLMKTSTRVSIFGTRET
jgi:solute carrier family 9B (sodium/hydrogen exchanger), member 1/2